MTDASTLRTHPVFLMRRTAWIHLLAAYLFIGASATPHNPTPDLHGLPADSLSDVRTALTSPRSNTHPEHVQDEEKFLNRLPSASFPRRYGSGRRRRRVHP
jgi:hypothetical protein